MGFVRDIVLPRGTLRLFSIYVTEKSMEQRIQTVLTPLFRERIKERKKLESDKISQLSQDLKQLALPLQKEGIFVAYRVLETGNFLEGFNIVTQIMKGMFFPPNIVFLTMGGDHAKDKNLINMVGVAIRSQLGVVILYLHPKAGFGGRGHINIWIRHGSPNLNLCVLMAMLIERNWNGNIRLISVVGQTQEKQNVISI